MLKYDLKPGDIIGFSGKGIVSDLINLGTYGIPRWSISHVAIIAEDYGRKYLFEASESDNSNGVCRYEPEDVINRYSGRVWVYPLYRHLYWYESARLICDLMRVVNRPYDSKGAIKSAGFFYPAIRSLFHGPDFVKLFCSELVASKFSEIGIYPTTNASRWNPNNYIRRLRQNGIVCKPKRLK